MLRQFAESEDEGSFEADILLTKDGFRATTLHRALRYGLEPPAAWLCGFPPAGNSSLGGSSLVPLLQSQRSPPAGGAAAQPVLPSAARGGGHASLGTPQYAALPAEGPANPGGPDRPHAPTRALLLSSTKHEYLALHSATGNGHEAAACFFVEALQKILPGR